MSTQALTLDSTLRPPREIWTTQQVAEYLRVTPHTVTNLAKRGELPGKRIGSLWRFYRDDIENLV